MPHHYLMPRDPAATHEIASAGHRGPASVAHGNVGVGVAMLSRTCFRAGHALA
jgi:hypothetical protein